MKFWRKIKQIDDQDPLKQVINEAIHHKIGFIQHYKNLDNQYNGAKEIVEKFFREIRASIRQNASEEKTKYMTYLKINPTLLTPDLCSNMRFIHVISKL